MKNFKRVLLVLVGFGSMALFTACGNNTTAANGVGGSCGSGYIYTSNMGCLQQTANCTGSMALVGGVCQNVSSSLVGTNTGTTAQTCQPGSGWSATYNQCLPQYGMCTGQYGIYNNACVALGSSSTGHTPYQGSCNSGFVQTSNGCMQQGICSAGYGFAYWGGQPYCFPANTTY
jgi:hypothetical protein